MQFKVFLLCVAAGGALAAGMIITHIGPGIHPKPVASSPGWRNEQRTELVGGILTALQQYTKDHGPIPIKLTSDDTQICTSAGPSCASKHLVDLGFLMTSGDYLPGIPHDPLGGHGLWGSGFYISELSDGTVRITAPEAENGEAISKIAKL